LSTKPLARPLLYLHATSVAFPNARRSLEKVRPNLPSAQGSSRCSATLQRFQAKRPFFAPGFGPGVQEALPCSSEVPPSGFGYPLGGVSSLHPRKHLSASHAHGFCPSGPRSGPVALLRFPGEAPLLRFPAKHFSLAPALQRLKLTQPAVSSCSLIPVRMRVGPLPS
jgi:hypothetical protein